MITATFPSLLVISGILLKEKKVETQFEEQIQISKYDAIETVIMVQKNKKDELHEKVGLFWSFLKMDFIYRPVIFIFLYMLAPSYGDPLFFFYTNELKFTPLVMGRLRLIYGIASVTGIWVYNKYLKSVPFNTIMWWTTILSIIFNMFSIVLVTRFNLILGIPDFVFCMAADALTTALAEINTMPLLVLACNICPKNIEGTLYAFLISVLNFGSLCSNQLGSLLSNILGITSTQFGNLSSLIFISNIVLLLPMPALYLINADAYNPNKTPKKKDKDQTDNNSYEEEETTLHTPIKIPTKTLQIDQNCNDLKLSIDEENKAY